jgi:hypothetical protein
VSDQPPSLHIVTGEPFLHLEQVGHDDHYLAQKLNDTKLANQRTRCG